MGRGSLARIVGDDVKYLDAQQFTVRPDERSGEWMVEPHPSVANPICLNGVPIVSITPLPDGGVLTVGSDRARLTVRIVDAG
jgi:hypothetical protein